MYNRQPVGGFKAERLHQPRRASCAAGKRWTRPAALGVESAAPPPTAASPMRSTASAWAPAPTRRCCWSTTDRWTSSTSGAAARGPTLRGEPDAGSTFQVPVHRRRRPAPGRHIGGLVYAPTLNGRNWGRGLRWLPARILGRGWRRGRRPPGHLARSSSPACAAAAAGRREPEVELRACAIPSPKYRSAWIPDDGRGRAPARTATSLPPSAQLVEDARLLASAAMGIATGYIHPRRDLRPRASGGPGGGDRDAGLPRRQRRRLGFHDLTCTAVPAPTSAAKKPPLGRWAKGPAAAKNRSPAASACTAGRRRSTMSRRSPSRRHPPRHTPRSPVLGRPNQHR